VTDVTVDVDLLRSEIEKTYTDVSTDPTKDSIFPTGRAWAEDLGYPAAGAFARPGSNRDRNSAVAGFR
jgi:hypothetical protein